MVKITFDTPETSQTEENANIILTEKAAERIQEIMEKKKEDGLKLRIGVQGGGCGGLSYTFKLVTEKEDSDTIVKNESFNKVEVLVNTESLPYLKGCIIDFEQTLEAEQFVIQNPNAKTSCGCGNSFSV